MWLRRWKKELARNRCASDLPMVSLSLSSIPTKWWFSLRLSCRLMFVCLFICLFMLITQLISSASWSRLEACIAPARACRACRNAACTFTSSSGSKGGGRTRRPPLIFGREKIKILFYHLPIVKVDRKGLKVTLARLSRVFLDIGLLKRQLMAATCLKPSRTSSSWCAIVAGTYNVPTPSHIIRLVLMSMFARIPQWLLKSLHVCISIMYAPWCGIIRPAGCLAGTRVGYRTLRQMGVRTPPRRGVGFPI